MACDASAIMGVSYQDSTWTCLNFVFVAYDALVALFIALRLSKFSRNMFSKHSKIIRL